MHRLDLETSGLLLLAKDKRTATELQSQFEGRRVRKTYLAVCAVLEDAPAAQKAAETRAKIREEEEEAEENNADEDEDEEIDGEELGVFDETDLEDDLDVNDDDDERRMTTATSGSSTSSTSPGRSEWSTPPSVRFFQLSYGQLE